MSGSAMADALITMLSATSCFGASMVSKNSYQILEQSTGSAAIVVWRNFNTVSAAFGNPTAKDIVWTLEVTAFCKDTGDPQTLLDKTFAAVDVILNCLKADDTLQGTAENVVAIRGSRKPDEIVEAGGAVWLPISVEVDAKEFYL